VKMFPMLIQGFAGNLVHHCILQQADFYDPRLGLSCAKAVLILNTCWTVNMNIVSSST